MDKRAGKIRTILLNTAFLWTALGASVCAAEMDHAEAMRSFGRVLMSADRLAAVEGNGAHAVADADLHTAVAGIDSALEIARSILNPECMQTLLAKKALAPEAQERYLSGYRTYMDRFIRALEEYRGIFAGLLATPAESRDFTAASDKKREIRALVGDAHAGL
jgi:hypothetical protein